MVRSAIDTDDRFSMRKDATTGGGSSRLGGSRLPDEFQAGLNICGSHPICHWVTKKSFQLV
jgi:hypothetical protein